MNRKLIHLSPDQFEQFLDLSGDIVYQTDAAGRITFVNARVEAVLGHRPESLVGSHYLTLVDPDARAEVYRFYSEQARRETQRTYREFAALSRSGRRVWVGQHVQLLTENGVVQGFHGVVRDLSELRRVQVDLEARDARMRLLTDLDSVTGTDHQRLEEALRRAGEILATDVGIISRVKGDQYEVKQYWPPDSGVHEGQVFELGNTYCDLTLSQGGVIAIEHIGESEYAAHPCFEKFALQSYIGAPIYVGGRPVGTLGFSSKEPRESGYTTADVDFVALLARWVGSVLEQGMALKRIKSVEGRLHTIVAASADGVLTCSPNGEILTLNAAAREMLGLETEPIGQDVRLYLPAFLKLERESVRSSTHLTEGMRPDGVMFEVELTVTRSGPDGSPVLAGIFRDVTDRNRDAAKLQRREATLRAFYDGTPFLMGILSLQGRRLVHLSANSAAIDFFGLLRPSAGSELPESLPTPEQWEKACGRCLADRKPVRFETTLRNRWLNVTVNLIDDPDADAPRFSYVVEDVTSEHAREQELARRKAEFEAIYWSIPHAAVFSNHDRKIAAVNPAFQRIFGYSTEQVLGLRADFLFAPDELQTVLPSTEEGPVTYERKYRRSSGEVFEAETIRVPVKGQMGAELGSLALIRDVTERNETRERLRVQADILSNVRDAVVVMDHELRISFWNVGAERLTGFTAMQAEGYRLVELTPIRWLDPTQEKSAIHGLLDEGSWDGRVCLTDKEGGTLFVDAVVSLMRDTTGEASGMLVVARDVTETVDLENQLRLQARADSLTNLPNRKVLDERIREAISVRDRTGEVFALLFIDVDRFKLVNDSLGHAVGDALLQQVAARIRSTLRDGDLVARIGGDEFAILLSQAGNEFEVRKVAERLAQSLNKPFRVSGKDIPSSASMGIVMGSTRYTDPVELLRDADTAMYEAKRKARGTFVMFSGAMHERVKRRFRLESDLSLAVANNQLELHYQPIVSLRDGALAGFEALLRWNHPELGTLSPDEFLPLASELGLLGDIDCWVLSEAAAQLSCWLSQRRAAPLKMHVNSSSDSVLTPEYREVVKRVMKDFELPAGALEVEITEQLLIEDPAAAAERLSSLKALGVNLSVDDFGTGYSSLNLLHVLPVDSVKTDRSLLEVAPEDERSTHILITIAKLSESLSLRLVGEGIETPQQLHRLRKLGFHYGQGFLFSKPRTAPKAEMLLRTPGWVGYWQQDSASEAGHPQLADRSDTHPRDRAAEPGRGTRQSSTLSVNSGTETRE